VIELIVSFKRELYRAVRGKGCTVTKGGKTKPVKAGKSPNLVLRESAATDEMVEEIEALGYETLRGGCSTMDSTLSATHIGAASIFHRVPSVRRCIGTLISMEAGGYLCDARGTKYECTHPKTMDSLVVARDQKTAERLLPLIERETTRRKG